MPNTTQHIPTAGEYAKCVDQIFTDLSFQLKYQKALTEMAFEEAFNKDVKLEALLNAARGNHFTAHELLFVNLQDTVKLLLERVKELELSHVQ